MSTGNERIRSITTRRWALALGALMLAPLLLVAQEAERKGGDEPLETGLVEETERRIVQLDVSFIPRKDAGIPEIPELEASDFELYIGGEEIRIEFADRVCREIRRTEATVARVSGAEGAAEAPPGPPPATFLFYLEHTLLTQQGMNNAFEMIEEMVRDLIVNGNRGILVSSGGRLVQSELTSDPQVLLDKLGAIQKDPVQWREYTYANDEVSRYDDIDRQPTQAMKELTAKAYQLDEARVTNNRLRRFAATLGAMAEIDPPKAVFYFGDVVRKRPGEHYLKQFSAGTGPSTAGSGAGDPTASSPGTDGPQGAMGENNPLLQSLGFDDVLKSANAQGVRVYPIQAQGLYSPSMLDPTSGPTDFGTYRFDVAEDTLKSFAVETGGEFFYGGIMKGQVEKILDKIDQDLSCFYILSFYPVELREDSPLPVLVRLNEETGSGAAAATDFRLRTRGQIVIQSPEEREEALLLAAYAAEATVDSDPGRTTAIPLAYENGEYRALVQFLVRGPDLPGQLGGQAVWDLGISRVQGAESKEDLSKRIQIDEMEVPVVLEAEMKFNPGKSEIRGVGREYNLGQLSTASLEIDWPDPNKSIASVSPIELVQESFGIFIRKQGKSEEPPRSRGSLGLGGGYIRPEQPTYVIGLVCRGKRFKDDLWVRRRLVGESWADFELLRWKFDGERCVQVRDLIAKDQMSDGNFTYRISVFDNEEMAGRPVVEGERQFTALSAETEAEVASQDL